MPWHLVLAGRTRGLFGFIFVRLDGASRARLRDVLTKLVRHMATDEVLRYNSPSLDPFGEYDTAPIHSSGTRGYQLCDNELGVRTFALEAV